ncbi:phosducin a [Megalops cyprinoides]|uniref:phosducin a n=1 Tax=Megalops cyprinoides TaxID=118141 RepID=UPI001864ECC6|nr:phosducin a [Megalops cyprinoides]
MSSASVDEEELPATHTGPKGVIHDWRKFKLESEDHDSLPPNKRELLRQMSNPRPPSEDNRERLNRMMSTQEYEMIQEEDEHCLRRYRKQCMQEMHERLSFGPTFDGVQELESGEAFLEAVEKEHRLTVVVVHVYEDDVPGCDALNGCFTCLSAEYPSVKFCRIRASRTGAGERFATGVLPALLVYKGGELLGNFLNVTQHLSEEFFAVDVEAFLNEYGLLPEKEFAACPEDEEEANVE